MNDAKLPERLARYKHRILSAPYEICLDRARYYTQSYRETEGQHPSKRAALAFKRTAEKMKIYILPEERLVGNRSSKILGVVLPVERGDFTTVLKYYIPELRKRKYKPYHITKEEERELKKEILPYWEGKTVNDLKWNLWMKNKLFVIPKLKFGNILAMAIGRQKGLEGYTGLKDVKFSKFLDRIDPHIIISIPDMQGHLCIGHCNVIPGGIIGLKKKILSQLETVRDEARREVLDSMLIALDAFTLLAKRFASEATKIAETEKDIARKNELLQIAENCNHISEHPPETFYQAIQLLWLYQVACLISHGAFAIFAIGRPDQYLYEYYKRDIESGRISKQFAYELICELLIKTSYNLFCLPEILRVSASELGADNQAITVGGVKRDGSDATNELSYMFLDAIAAIKNMTNSFSIRLHKNSPKEFVRKAIALYRTTSGPALFNDECIIPALMEDGVTPEDARDYAIVGCVEPTPQGNAFPCTSANDISIGGVLELTLRNGRLAMTKNRISIETGAPETFASFEQLKQAYARQLRYQLGLMAKAVNIKDLVYRQNYHNPLISVGLLGCIESGKDMTEGGAKYNFSSITGKGFATVVDSLAAIQKIVYKERRVTMSELMKALDRDFNGYEPLRNYLVNKCPKFGTDNDEADDIAVWLAEFFCRTVKELKLERGGIFRPAFYSYGMHVSDGAMLGALPNGRRAGEPLSNSISPTNGTETLGPTAVILSLSKLNHRLISDGNSLNLRFTPQFLSTEEGLEKVIALVTTYFKLLGLHIQFNVVSSSTLRDAQKHPEKYRDLIVRVSGYTAYFVDLGRPIQNDIIRRTEFSNG